MRTLKQVFENSPSKFNSYATDILDLYSGFLKVSYLCNYTNGLNEIKSYIDIFNSYNKCGLIEKNKILILADTSMPIRIDVPEFKSYLFNDIKTFDNVSDTSDVSITKSQFWTYVNTYRNTFNNNSKNGNVINYAGNESASNNILHRFNLRNADYMMYMKLQIERLVVEQLKLQKALKNAIHKSDPNYNPYYALLSTPVITITATNENTQAIIQQIDVYYFALNRTFYVVSFSEITTLLITTPLNERCVIKFNLDRKNSGSYLRNLYLQDVQDDGMIRPGKFETYGYGPIINDTSKLFEKEVASGDFDFILSKIVGNDGHLEPINFNLTYISGTFHAVLNPKTDGQYTYSAYFKKSGSTDEFFGTSGNLTTAIGSDAPISYNGNETSVELVLYISVTNTETTHVLKKQLIIVIGPS